MAASFLERKPTETRLSNGAGTHRPLARSPHPRVSEETQRHEQRAKRHHQRNSEQRTVAEVLGNRAADERCDNRDHCCRRIRQAHIDRTLIGIGIAHNPVQIARKKVAGRQT